MQQIVKLLYFLYFLTWHRLNVTPTKALKLLFTFKDRAKLQLSFLSYSVFNIYSDICNRQGVWITADHNTLWTMVIIRRHIHCNPMDVIMCYQHLLTDFIPGISLKWQVWRGQPTIETMAFIFGLFQDCLIENICCQLPGLHWDHFSVLYYQLEQRSVCPCICNLLLINQEKKKALSPAVLALIRKR